ncbi:MAG: hypothetical protein IKJ67_00765 [Bacteroidales bacterium]|nr:hypothetical protein [Bacteroidales bacterium]
MKKTLLKLLAMFVTLATINVSCQKDEDEITPTQKNDIMYWIDGEEASKTFISKDEKQAFIKSLVALAQQGRIISFEEIGNSSKSKGKSDRQTIETANKTTIEDWAMEMGEKQYNVTIIYNKETGTYTGIATKRGNADLVSGKVWRYENIHTDNVSNILPVEGEVVILDFISPIEGGKYIYNKIDSNMEATTEIGVFAYKTNTNSGKITITTSSKDVVDLPFAIVNNRLHLIDSNDNIFIFEDKGNRENYDF